MVSKRHVPTIALILLVASVSIANAYTYSQQIKTSGQAIKNKPNYYVTQLSNAGSPLAKAPDAT